MNIVCVLLEVQIENIEGSFTRRCAGMSFVAVALGGITRLTESGLSMVDWKLFGRRPPITAEVCTKEYIVYLKGDADLYTSEYCTTFKI